MTGLKLLRAGASLVVTTRFPHDCAARYRVRLGEILVSLTCTANGGPALNSHTHYGSHQKLQRVLSRKPIWAVPQLAQCLTPRALVYACRGGGRRSPTTGSGPGGSKWWGWTSDCPRPSRPSSSGSGPRYPTSTSSSTTPARSVKCSAQGTPPEWFLRPHLDCWRQKAASALVN